MPRISYQVIATLPSPDIAAEYVAWLQDGHIQQVLKGGAGSAAIVRLDPDPPENRPRVATQYTFPAREAFDRYVAVDAPALRADGLKRFPPERGITFQRIVGAILDQ